jgi:hypothetical protein
MSDRSAFWLCALAVAAGAALRAPGMASDFWLDEVWTWWKSQRLAGPLGVFTALHDSNNHHLNTLWVYALGQGAPVWLYRLPAWLAGTASVALGARLAWRRGRLEAVLAAWLLAGSFALVHFSSEARGYAPVVACALAAQWALESTLARPRVRSALLFGLAVVAGLLFQLFAIFYWAGAFVQSAWRWRRMPLRVRVAHLLALHALPLLALAALYAVDLHAMQIGSGDPTDLARLCAEIVGDGFGLPVLPALALPYAGLALALVGGGLALRARDGDDAWLGFAVTILIAPVAVFAALRPEVIAVRYFLIGIAFALLLCADLAAAGLRAGGARRALAAALLLAFALGNARLILDFARLGRGGFGAAVAAMAAGTEAPQIVVGSDHDFRNRLVLEFYARRLAPEKPLVYLPHARWPQEGPEWLVRHAARRTSAPAPRMRVDGHAYALFAEYDHAAISGFYWTLYRRAPDDARTNTRVPNPEPLKGAAPNAATGR